MTGRAHSLRARLTAWYALNLTVVLVALGGLLYGVVRHQLLVHHDGELRRAAGAAAAVLASEPDCERLTEAQVAALDRLGHVVLFHEAGAEGRVFYRSADSESLPVPPDEPLPAVDGTFRTLDAAKGLVRAFSLPYRAHSGRRGVIHVLEGLGDVVAPLASLRLALLVMGPIAILVSAVGGYWLVGRTLARVDEITRLAREIEADNLGRRLPGPGAEDEVGRLVATFNQMIGRLDASFDAMRRFTADASHELRTPLAHMRAAIDVTLSRPREVAEYAAALHEVGLDVDRLRAIVGDLLVLARADAGRIAMERQPVRLDVLAGEVVESFQAAAAERGVALALGPADAVTVLGDERWLRQLLANLVGNAVKFSRAPAASGAPLAVVSVAARTDGAEITVADSGPGFPDDALPHVFDRFYRADTARSAVEGSGLGLAIAAWIATAHGGSIVAANRPGGGAECRVLLRQTGAPT
ncbi:MAG: HAMP domain-containing protein [Vicinamibacteria bacterium]|nr:HAMP domain-containing protein [Vicinamibacteria bacterium]